MKNAVGWETARCSRCRVGQQRAEKERRNHLMKVCQQINVNVSWAAFHVVSRIEEEVWKFFMTSYYGVIRFEEQQVRDQGPLY